MIITIQNNTASGHRTGWTKHVTAVDIAKSNGYAFEGEFLNEGEAELPTGAVIVQKNPMGSVKNNWFEGVCSVVQPDDTLLEIATNDWHTEFITFRNAVAAQLGKKTDNAYAHLREAYETMQAALIACPRSKNVTMIRQLQDIATYLGITK